MAPKADETAIATLRRLGFRAEAENAVLLPDVRFSRDDCALFERYPKSVPWNKENVTPADQAHFKSIRDRLKSLALWLAQRVNSFINYPDSMRGFASLYQGNAQSHQDIWCCIFPQKGQNKSYALQVALIVSKSGAEACICLGSGRSSLKRPGLDKAEQALRHLQQRLEVIPPGVALEVKQSLPETAVLRTPWREPGNSEFDSIEEWAAYAGSSKGLQSSISVFINADELEKLDSYIGTLMLELAEDAQPLFSYCYSDQYSGVNDNHKQSKPDGALCGQCRHTWSLHHNGTTACTVPSCKAGPDGTPCPRFISEVKEEPIIITPSADFDADTLEERASAEPYNLQLDSEVYRALIAAIRGRKHVILTGPPGTAKTTLAEAVSALASDAGWSSGYTLTTATSDWTTYETIGGLRPAESGNKLEFHQGILLDAIEENRWAVIDELNRSNFDRAFGQLFTVLSGQSVVLPYEDPKTGSRIVLCPDGAAEHYRRSGYKVNFIPENWRIVATMNVFDKSLLFEMSFALMRRFAFIEVPSPGQNVFESLWNRELEDLPPEHAENVRKILHDLLALRSVKEIGPAVFIDMARFAREYLGADADLSPGQLAFQLFYSFLLPQYEGITQLEGEKLFDLVLAVTGSQYKKRLTVTLAEVLGITFLSEDSADGDIDGGLAGPTGTSV